MPKGTQKPRVVYGDQPILTTYRRRGGTPDLLWWLALAMGAFLVAYPLALRPWHLHWGVTVEEAQRPLPGDDLIPRPLSEATRAVTVDARPEDVWPWLVQMGQGRGGMYSYDWLANLFGCDIHTVDRILPDLQQLGVGDTVRLASEERFPDAQLVVAEVQPGRALVLRSPPGDGPEPDSGSQYTYSWAFVLDRLDEGSTRLLVRARYEITPRLIGAPALFLGLEPVEFVMTQKMLRSIKELAEPGSST